MTSDIEYVDLVDSRGIIQKRNILRSEVDSFPDLYLQIIIGVIFNQKKQILVHSRAKTKKVDPGKIDHVCGGVKVGEKPKEAFLRESLEETGVKVFKPQIIQQGINKYKRYRYLLSGYSEDQPQVDPDEAEWVKFMHYDELKKIFLIEKQAFVEEFFEETEQALQKEWR